MNNDKVDECKCERCLQPIEDSSDVQSLGDYDIICESCISSFDECSGHNCSEIGSGFTMSSHGDHYCGSCEDNLTQCYECEELIDGHQHSLYTYNDDTYCNSCADDNYAYECSCGTCIYISTASSYEDYDFVINEMCEECHDRGGRIEHIDGNVETSIDKSILEGAYIKQPYGAKEPLTEAKRKDLESFSKFFNNFFGYTADDYEKQKLIIRKGAFGYERWGWFETSVEITSELNDKIFKMLDYLICDNSSKIYRPHRKFGRYQPFAFAFAELCQFYITNDIKNDNDELLFDGDDRYIKGRYPSLESVDHLRNMKVKLKSLSPDKRELEWEAMEMDANLWLKYYVDYIDRATLRECVKSRKMPDGKCLIKTVNKLISQHIKSANQFWEMENTDEGIADGLVKYTAHPLAESRFDKVNSGYKLYSCWELFNYRSFWERYCTNSISVTIPARIGFDSTAHEKVIAFNESVGACQGASYKDTLGFNHISMSSNPHLYLLFYNPEDESSIIGRAVIRLFWKRDKDQKMGYGEPSKKTLYIAPSRIYLDGYSHGKNQFYAGMYKVLDEWKDVIAERLGANEVKMIAYERTRHDSYSIKDYVDMAKDDKISIKVKEIDPKTEQYKNGNFVTDWFYPIWLEKPSEESYWGYYPDEYQGYESAYVDSSVYSQYATRETYHGQYSYIEVKNE